MAKLTTAARPYARAAYAAARQDDSAQWSSALDVVSQIVKDDVGKSLVNDTQYSINQVEEVVKAF